MIRPETLSRTRQTEVVVLSFRGFACWWVLILGVHLVTFVFNACFAKFYWVFDSMLLSYSLETYDVGMSREYFHAIAYVHVALAAAHSGYLLLMVVGSLRRRTLVFSPWSDTVHQCGNSRDSSKRSRNMVVVNNRVHNGDQNSLTRSTIHMLRRATTTYANIANRRGMLGVNGRYFYMILICRELVETAFQTVQAFRMSKYLPRAALNRFYVSLLVINCWSSVLVHTSLIGTDEARRRSIAIVCDCALDLMSSMGISIMIVLSYVNDYDAEQTGFVLELLDDDNWIAQMLDEARLVLVSSWTDLVARVVFSLGLVLTTASMKELLRWAPAKGNRIQLAKGPSSDQLQHLGSIRPPNSSLVPYDNPKSRLDETGADRRGYRFMIPRHFCWCHDARLTGRVRRVAFKCVPFIFLSWGIVVLVFHVQASQRSSLVECNPKVNPMTGVRPACFAVEFNCYNIGITGRREEVIAEWERFDHTTVVKLHIVHCPDLEMPEMFQEFIRLREIWVYNSSIRDWGPEAAVTNSCHPNLTVLSLVRTSMTNGLLPLGFQSTEFPINLTQIYFCETNLQTLPEDLGLKWNFSSTIYIENSKLTTVPAVLVQLQPSSLSLAGNPITALSPELFGNSLIEYIFLSHTDVMQLPGSVTPLTGATFFDFSGTNIAFFWSWIDPLVENMLGYSPRLAAGGSPYCSDLDKILSGAATDFSVPFRPGFSRWLMNSSEANLEVLRQAVDCSPSLSLTQFPLESWDMQYGMSS